MSGWASVNARDVPDAKKVALGKFGAGCDALIEFVDETEADGRVQVPCLEKLPATNCPTVDLTRLRSPDKEPVPAPHDTIGVVESLMIPKNEDGSCSHNFSMVNQLCFHCGTSRIDS